MINKLSARASLMTVATVALTLGVPGAHGATFTASGQITAIDPTAMGGFFSAVTVGSSFSVRLTYGDTASTPDFVSVSGDETNYPYSGGVTGGFLTIGGLTVNFEDEVSVNIQDDHPLDEEEADFAMNDLGIAGATEGTPIDVWAVEGLEAGTSFNASDDLVNGHDVEIDFVSLDTSLFDDLSFRPIPPALGQTDVVILTIEEADNSGVILFSAIGEISSASAEVPEPTSLWLLGAGVAGFFSRARRSRVHGQRA
jgi:hypothetical protein